MALEERTCKDIPSKFITKLIEITQSSNMFNQDQCFQQVGVAMGIHPAHRMKIFVLFLLFPNINTFAYMKYNRKKEMFFFQQIAKSKKKVYLF